MVTGINYQVCTNCRLCENICMQDVFHYNEELNKMEIKYPDDCCSCFECHFICAVEAISVAPGAPAKFNVKKRWNQIKEVLEKKELF